jgi:phage protein D
MLLGVNLTLLIGPGVPLPATPDIAEAVQSVSVTNNDEGRSGFQIVLQVGRAGPTDLLDYRLLLNPLLRPFSRVILVVLFGGRPRVLMDGLVTNQHFSPGNQPGTATLTLTGEDVSIAMDMEKKRAEYPAMDETTIATLIIASYAQYGLVPDVTPPPTIDVPLPIERTPVQQGTDLDQLKSMAQRFGYVFYVAPGPLPGMNMAHWGPPQRTALPQRALTVNQGPEQNVESISFAYNGLAPTIVKDEVQDRLSNMSFPVMTFVSLRLPPLAAMPALPFQLPNVRTSLLEQNTGLSVVEAYSRAQGITDKSVDGVVTAQGELDALRYGDLLEARGIVGLRGAGFTYDGLYYVKSVSHAISKGQYKQRFSLTREGTGAITPVVVP